MKKLILFLAFIFFCSSVGFAANEGSGPIKFHPEFEKRFKNYLNYVKNEKKYVFVFAVHPNGANDFQAVTSENESESYEAYRGAERRAISACNKKATKKGCKIFARGDQIVWNWDSIPDVYYTLIESSESFEYISWKDVTVQIGEGSVSLSKDTEKKFQEYLTIYENNKDEISFHMFFAISVDGKYSGDMEGYLSKIPKIKFSSKPEEVTIEQLQGLAVAECMTNAKKEKCYLYAINDEIVWK